MILISECKDKGFFTAKQKKHRKARPLVATTRRICDKKQRMMPELSHEFVGVDGLSNFSCNNTTMRLPVRALRTLSPSPSDWQSEACGLWAATCLTEKFVNFQLSTINYQLSTSSHPTHPTGLKPRW